MQGGCTEQNIKIRNNFSPAAKMSAHFCKLFDDRKVEGKKLKVVKK